MKCVLDSTLALNVSKGFWQCRSKVLIVRFLIEKACTFFTLVYIPYFLKFPRPLIFTHLSCAKIRGRGFAQGRCTNLRFARITDL